MSPATADDKHAGAKPTAHPQAFMQGSCLGACRQHHNSLRDAQPDTALHDCILSLPQHLWSRHFTRLCKSVYSWGHISGIQPIKGTASPRRWTNAFSADTSASKVCSIGLHKYPSTPLVHCRLNCLVIHLTGGTSKHSKSCLITPGHAIANLGHMCAIVRKPAVMQV